ncbi:MAG TPA: glycoside hydrolase family 38 C-terminal domain-containing protein [Bryocella sp.]|nr:glycoside hydrolase family 38 C-terminal domain-containing protein [Bryocella sp.]
MEKTRFTTAAAVLMLCAAWPAIGTAQAGQAIATFPSTAQATLNRLSGLDHLPSGTWRYHTADMPHGEDPNLDDSAWPVAESNRDLGTQAIWFRRWIDIPKSMDGYDLTGAAIWFHASVDAHLPLTQIIYVNGRRIAMGDNIEPVELLAHVTAGERILVAVKALATVLPKRFNGTQITIHFSPDRPNPVDLRDEVLSAAILLPSVEADASADKKVLEKAVDEIDMKALDAGDQKRFDASLREAQSTLEPLRPTMQKVKISLDGDAHIDAAWLWPWTETVDVVRRTFSTALQLMDEYPGYVFTQSAAAYNEWMAEKYPDINDEIAKRIKEGRWEVVGGMWVEPDLNMPDGESTARSLLIGKRWYQQHYGVDVRVGWNPDSFGYNWQLPQIYKKSGVDYFVTQKMSWNDTNQLPLKLFWWESPDGSKVLTYFPHGYTNRDVGSVRLSANMVQARQQAPGMTEMLDLYGVGDHGGGPTRVILDQASRWMQTGKVAPQMHFGTANAYFESVEKQIAKESPVWDYRSIAEGYHAPQPEAGSVVIPTWKDELYLETHRGVFTTQANQKRNLRKAPEATLNAEKFASLAWLAGDSYPGGQLTEAWKKIAFNGFHDLAAGSGIAQVYRDAQKDFDDVRWIDEEVSRKALDTVSAQIDTRVPEGVPVLVFNPLAWKRSGFVTVKVQLPDATSEVSVLDSSGQVLPSEVISRETATNRFLIRVLAREVPSMGYSVLRVVPGRRGFTSDLAAHGTTIENASLRVTVDPKTGCITSLFDKRANFETLAQGSCGNELQAFKDTPKIYDAWNIDPGTLDQPPARLDQAESVKLVSNTPLRAVVRVTRSWQSSKFVQDIELGAGSDEVVVDNNIDWHETHVLLKAAFPLAASAPFATYEIPYGTIQRPTTRNNSFEKARFEVPAQKWADLGDGKQGFSLINESKFGYDAVGNLLRLTLLRSPVYPDPNADRGPNHFRYALYPHAGSWQGALTVRKGFEFNYPLIAMQATPHNGPMPSEHSFLRTSSDNVVITAMKKAEDTHSLIVHLYEWKGQDHNVDIDVPAGATGATETNLMEKPEGGNLPLNGNRVTVHVHPFEIVSFRLDYADKSNVRPGAAD